MTSDRQTLQEIADRIFSDIQTNIPELNPSVRQSIVRAVTLAFSGRFFDLYTQQALLKQELFPITATQLDFIRFWGIFKGNDILPAARAQGLMTINSEEDGVIVPQATVFVSPGNGLLYSTLEESATETTILQVANISRNGNVVEIETEVENHGLAVGTGVDIKGVDQPEYNVTGTTISTVTAPNRFTYYVDGTPSTDPTGTNITVTFQGTQLEVLANDAGLAGNLDNGSQLNIQTSITDLFSFSNVQFTTISGGAEEETVLEYKKRVIRRYQKPVAFFNVYSIENDVLKIPGNTRAWAFSTTPRAGFVTVYFVRDNTVGILPTGEDVNETYQSLLPTPADIPFENLIVKSPLAKVIDFNFVSLIPNTIGMQNAIRGNLEEFFKKETTVGENISPDAYRSAIYRSQNEETGEFVKSFDLAQPHGTIEVGTGELALLGNISF